MSTVLPDDPVGNMSLFSSSSVGARLFTLDRSSDSNWHVTQEAKDVLPSSKIANVNFEPNGKTRKKIFCRDFVLFVRSVK